MYKKAIETIKICFLIMISCVLISTPALAGEKSINTSAIPIIAPRYTYINSASSMLTISDGTATIKGSVQKTPSGENISLTCILQKKSGFTWKNIKSWSDSSSTDPVSYNDQSTRLTLQELTGTHSEIKICLCVFCHVCNAKF